MPPPEVDHIERQRGSLISASASALEDAPLLGFRTTQPFDLAEKIFRSACYRMIESKSFGTSLLEIVRGVNCWRVVMTDAWFHSPSAFPGSPVLFFCALFHSAHPFGMYAGAMPASLPIRCPSASKP
jgi:hypothetical protein